MSRVLLLVTLLLVVGCGPRPLEPYPPPLSEVHPAAAGPISSVHYRAFADADALAAYLRWTPGAPTLLSAHRGGPRPGLPENALATFEHTLNFAPALIECDVRRAADGTLVLLHDDTLDRTTTGSGPLTTRTLADLRRLRLLDLEGQVTPFRIPTLAEALAWAENRATLMLDVKEGVPPAELIAALRAAEAENRVVVIVYTLEDLLAYYRLAPDLVYSAMAMTPEEVTALLAAPVDRNRLIAFAGVGAVDAAVVARLHEAGLRVQVGTFGELDEAAGAAHPGAYRPLLDAGVDVLATDNVPTAALAIRPGATN
ncbi:MAG: glycerophosphodiester phosphodiesterase family protein [Rhodothermaceae bacterium]|nr:glycerophosphodiester phosphodiesterase family protein [Rhodothermaceae bacterium]